MRPAVEDDSNQSSIYMVVSNDDVSRNGNLSPSSEIAHKKTHNSERPTFSTSRNEYISKEINLIPY